MYTYLKDIVNLTIDGYGNDNWNCIKFSLMEIDKWGKTSK